MSRVNSLYHVGVGVGVDVGVRACAPAPRPVGQNNADPASWSKTTVRAFLFPILINHTL